MIDGKKDGVPPGTVYDITFEWTDDKKTLSWQYSDADPALDDMKIVGSDFEHKYYLLGSWKRFEIFQMMKLNDEGQYYGTFEMGYRQMEEFQIIRDADLKHAIYPSSSKVPKNLCPILGPDDKGMGSEPGKGKNFQVRAPQHQTVYIMLDVKKGQKLDRPMIHRLEVGGPRTAT